MSAETERVKEAQMQDRYDGKLNIEIRYCVV